MGRRMICSLAILSILLTSIATTSTVTGADYTRAGVKPGDIAQYHFTSNEPLGDWSKMVMTIINVTSSIVTANWTCYYSNGTIEDIGFGGVHTGNVSEGAIGFWPWLIPPNLKVGDQIFLLPGAPTIVDSTTTRVAGVERTVNHWNHTFAMPGYLWDYCWDQETGLLVNMTHQDWYHHGNYSWILTYTNAWGPGLVESVVVFCSGAHGGYSGNSRCNLSRLEEEMRNSSRDRLDGFFLWRLFSTHHFPWLDLRPTLSI